MKSYLLNGLVALQRPVALMLTLVPIAGLFVTYCIVQWTFRMTENAHMTNPELALTIEGYASFFGDYVMPVLALSVLLAVLNLSCAFALRQRKAS